MKRPILVLLAHTELALAFRVKQHAQLVRLANIVTAQAYSLPLEHASMDSAVLLALPRQLELGLAQQTPIASVAQRQLVRQVRTAVVLVQQSWTSALSVHQVKSVLTTPEASFRAQQAAIVLVVLSVLQTLILLYTSAQLAIIARLEVLYHSSAFQVRLALPLALPRVLCALQAHIAPVQDSRLLWLAQPIENVQQLALSNQECALLAKAPMEQEHVQHAQPVNTVGQSLARTA